MTGQDLFDGWVRSLFKNPLSQVLNVWQIFTYMTGQFLWYMYSLNIPVPWMLWVLEKVGFTQYIDL